MSPAPALEHLMSNPWSKKNPLMSLWLSSAHKAAGSARGLMTAETRRQAAALRRQGSREVIDFWTGLMSPLAPRRRKKPR